MGDELMVMVTDVSSEGKQTVREAELYEQIGRLKMELEWLKKKAAQFG